MKQTEEQYANELIDKYDMIIYTDQDHYRQVYKCSIQDVENTIEAIDWHEFEVPNKQIEFYQTVLQILKDKL